MMQFFYNVGVACYSLAVRVAALWNSKARKRVRGYGQTDGVLQHIPIEKKRVWFHCASLGEFEQGRPLIEKYQSDPNWEVYVSFFSPSGFEVVQKKQLVENLFYLKPDTKKNAKKTLNLLQPDLVIFVKYEFWANHVFEIAKRKIPLFCVSGLFREGQIYFKYRFFARVLKSFDFFYLQNERSLELLQSIHVSDAEVTGDTRFDRVAHGASKANSVEEIKSFLNGETAFLIGSSWPDDEAHLFELISEERFDQKVILAPHEIGAKHIQDILKNLGEKAICFSKWKQELKGDYQFLVIDNIGMLSNLYQYGDIAYVGGAFHGSLHNILEPAAFALPVIFGPSFEKFPEGQRFLENGIGFSIRNTQELKETYWEVNERKEQLRNKVSAFVNENVGATEEIYQSLTQRFKDQ